MLATLSPTSSISATIVRPTKLDCAVTMPYRRTVSGRGRRSGPFTSRSDQIDGNDLVTVLKRVSIGTGKAVQVPPLSAYSRDLAQRGDDSEDKIVVSPTIPEARPIPSSFPSTDKYLEVRQNIHIVK